MDKSQKKSIKSLQNIAKRATRWGFFLILFPCILFFSITSALAVYEQQNRDKIYPGIKVGNINVSGKNQEEVLLLFEAKNKSFSQATFTFVHGEKTATVSGEKLRMGYNARLIADQAYSLGRTGNLFADLFNKGLAWQQGLLLRPSYAIDGQVLTMTLTDIAKDITIVPVDAIFEMENNRVIAFRPSTDGKAIDQALIEETILSFIPNIIENPTSKFTLQIPITIAKPAVSLEDTNNMGIKQHLGKGVSKYTGSNANRIHNVALATSTIDGTIVPAGQTFSFNDTLGDVSVFTGYKQGYVIRGNKTVLGDGGGVCQVSTTLYRAILNAGLPIVERHPHSYRVRYYEQESHPGFDATVYAPGFDLKFKNDTGYAILIEAYADFENDLVVFDLYGTGDGRDVAISTPVVTNQIPAPEDLYQDDPTLPVGVVKQIDFRASGATATFDRTVSRNGEMLISEKIVSKYHPWQAVFLRGTKTE